MRYHTEFYFLEIFHVHKFHCRVQGVYVGLRPGSPLTLSSPSLPPFSDVSHQQAPGQARQAVSGQSAQQTGDEQMYAGVQ